MFHMVDQYKKYSHPFLNTDETVRWRDIFEKFIRPNIGSCKTLKY